MDSSVSLLPGVRKLLASHVAHVLTPCPDNRVVFVTGGAGTICSAQTRALVRLGADACIIGRNVEKTEKAAKDIATVRKGARVIGIGGCDVRNVSVFVAASPVGGLGDE